MGGGGRSDGAPSALRSAADRDEDAGWRRCGQALAAADARLADKLKLAEL